MKMKSYSKQDGYTERDLVHYATDHLKAARELYRTYKSIYVDSAAYLAHLGLELLLKSCLLYSTGQFPKTHDLAALHDLLDTPVLSAAHRDLLSWLDGFSGSRYPHPKAVIPAGTEDWGKIQPVMQAIVDAMPVELQEIVVEVDRNLQTTKGGRQLYEKEIDKAANKIRIRAESKTRR